MLCNFFDLAYPLNAERGFINYVAIVFVRDLSCLIPGFAYCKFNIQPFLETVLVFPDRIYLRSFITFDDLYAAYLSKLYFSLFQSSRTVSSHSK